VSPVCYGLRFIFFFIRILFSFLFLFYFSWLHLILPSFIYLLIGGIFIGGTRVWTQDLTLARLLLEPLRQSWAFVLMVAAERA
jgi:hypothetical protein